MKSAMQVLIAARRLISKPERWCQGYYAFDKKGNFVDPSDDGAVRWCAEGACLRVAQKREFDDHPALQLLRNQLKRNDIPNWNDTRRRTHKQVLNLFDKAIETA